MIDIKNSIKESLSKGNPVLDTRDGSVISDVLIEPLSFLLNRYELDVKNSLSISSFKNPESIPESLLDEAMSFFLLTRRSGTKATGEIYLYFSSPVSMTIYSGTTFTSRENKLVFESTRDFTITKAIMVNNYETGYYFIGPIPVIAADYGDTYSLPKDSLFDINTRVTPSPIKIQNKVGFTTAASKETNTELFERLKRTVNGSSLSSPLNIKNVILNEDPNIAAIEIIGANSPYMWRDLIYGSSDINAFAKETFQYARSGLHDLADDVPHSMWSNNFLDIDPTDEVAFPTIESWATEATDYDYQSVSKLDARYLEQKQLILVDEFNSNLGVGANALYTYNNAIGNPWKFNDTTVENGLRSLDEITLNGIDGILLGSTQAEYLAIPASIRLARRNGTMTEQEFLAWFNAYNISENENNYFPIIHRELSQNAGIAVEFTFKTTDNTEEGRVCFATTRRNKTKFYVHDGFGLAFKKQPQYLIRMQKNAYGSNSQLRSDDLAKFAAENNVTTTVAATYLGNITSHKEFWKFNVFLVDNDAITEKINVNYENLIETSTGINQFVQATKVWIEPNVNYYVRYYIYEGMGFKAWINTTANAFTDTNKVLYKGQSYPGYVQVTGNENFDVIDGRFSEDANRKSFGISVLNTKNYTWAVRDLKIYSIMESLPMHLFKFYIDPLKYNVLTGSVILDYYGMAFDETLMLPNYTGNRAKLKLGVYNHNTEAWETIGYNTYDPYPQISENVPLTLDDLKISDTIDISAKVNDKHSYLSPDGYLYIAATAANSGSDFSDNKSHTLRTYYVEVRNGDPVEKHRGNCTDIYCHNPENIKYNSVSTYMESTDVYTANIAGIDGYIQEITRIEEFYTGTEFSASSYVITNVDRGNTYGSSANYKISFNTGNYVGGRIKIYYKYWANGVLINNLVTNSELRFPSADYAVKIMPPVVINISNLKYSGGLDANLMKVKLVDYINSNLIKFDKSDIVNVLYTNGANYVDLNMTISIREYDLFAKRTNKVLDSQTYEVPDTIIARLYTDINEMSGVVKL
jgi:hypothetical protein